MCARAMLAHLMLSNATAMILLGGALMWALRMPVGSAAQLIRQKVMRSEGGGQTSCLMAAEADRAAPSEVLIVRSATKRLSKTYLLERFISFVSKTMRGKEHIKILRVQCNSLLTLPASLVKGLTALEVLDLGGDKI